MKSFKQHLDENFEYGFTANQGSQKAEAFYDFLDSTFDENNTAAFSQAHSHIETDDDVLQPRIWVNIGRHATYGFYLLPNGHIYGQDVTGEWEGISPHPLSVEKLSTELTHVLGRAKKVKI